MDQNTLLIVIGGLILVAVIIALVMAYVVPRRRSQHLRDQFGPEYDRAVELHGDKQRAEAALAERKQHVSSLRLRDLAPVERSRFADKWQSIQAGFVDKPESSIREADRLVAEVMTARGYPMENFEARAGDLSVSYPDLVENYRRAHAIYLSSERGADTEDLRQALIYYRDIFAELLDQGSLHRTA